MSTNINITATTTQAQQQFAILQSASDRLSRSFGGLKSALAGLAVGALVAQTIRFADSVQDISTATGLAIENVTGLSNAFTNNGGSALGAEKAILKLQDQLDAAAGGSREAQVAFEKVGLSLTDLGRASSAEVLEKTIQGLAAMSDETERLATAQRLLGKEARLVDFVGVAAGLSSATAEASKYSSSVREAAALQGTLDAAFVKLQHSILRALEPLAKFVNSLKPEQIDRFVEAVVKIGGAAVAISAVATVVGKLLPLITSIGAIATSAFLMFNTGASQAGKTIAGLHIRWNGFLKAFGAADSLLTKFGAVWLFIKNTAGKTIPYLAGGLARMIPVVGLVVSALYALNEAVKIAFNVDPIDFMITKLDSLAAKLEQVVANNFPALAEGINKLGSNLGMAPPPSARPQQGLNTGSGPRGQIGEGREKEVARLKEAEQKTRDIATQISTYAANLKTAVQQYQTIGAQTVANLGFETSLLNKSEEQVAVLRARREEQQRAISAVNDLEKQYQDITEQLKAGKITQEEAQGILYEISKAQKAIMDSSEATVEAAAAATLLYQQGVRAKEIELKITQAILDQQEQMIEYNREIAAYQDQVNAARVSAFDQVEALKQENILSEQRASLEMSIRNLRGQDQETTRAIFDLEQKRLQQLRSIREIQDLPYDERLQRERDVNDEIDRARTVLEGRAEIIRNEQNSFVYGWTQAFAEYANAATAAADQAKNIFTTVTKGIEDSFVNFAKTGKLSFKDLFKSITETILRSQVQNLLATAFGGGGGGGSFLGNLFSAFLGGGRAAGGPVSAGRAYTVGESGPETFVPTGAGTIVPGTGATSVTYNINAVDASSFRSMIAQDPEFLFAVTEQGRRRQPSQRR
jgi:hypothetical protein